MTTKTSTKTDKRPPSQRSSVTNGTRLFIDRIDGRTSAARRFRDILDEITEDMGGPIGLSEVQRQLVRRFASLSIEAENQEIAIAEGKPLDVATYGQIVAALVRMAKLLGLERKLKVLDGSAIDSYLNKEGAGK